MIKFLSQKKKNNKLTLNSKPLPGLGVMSYSQLGTELVAQFNAYINISNRPTMGAELKLDFFSILETTTVTTLLAQLYLVFHHIIRISEFSWGSSQG